MMDADGHPADGLQDRLIDFALRIIKVGNALPSTPAGRHIAGQLLRSGTSPAPNYGEARAAESRADFIHKLKIVLKELKETSVWLIMIQRARLLKGTRLQPIAKEAEELSRIINASIATAKRLNKGK